MIRDEKDVEEAEIIREKGTNRSKYYRGQIDKYTWINYGSSYLPSDMNAAYLYAQLEIAEEIGIPISEVACALDAVSEPISFYEPVYSDGEESLALLDQLADKKENSDNWSEKISLYEALKEVPERELEVIKMRYFDGRTQIEISQEVGISQAQVSRLEKSALERIRTALA